MIRDEPPLFPRSGGRFRSAVGRQLPIRSHLAIVDISHDRDQVSITYKDSTNLNYDADSGIIHPNYNSWVKNLQKAIFIQVSAI